MTPRKPLIKDVERPTLKTIADLSGLAVATVSRALNDAPDIGQKTKERVRQIAREVGYRPNRAGLRLRTGKTNVISLVMATDQDIMNHTARLITSIAAGTRDTPYHMIVTPYFPEEDPLDPIRYIVETGSADGVIFNQIQPEDSRVAYLMERGFPFATHGRSRWCAKHPYFDFDNEVYARIAVEHLARRGRRSVCLVAPPQGQNYARNMIDGGEAAARETGIDFAVLEGVTSDDSSGAVASALTAHLDARPETDAILCGSGHTAIGATKSVEDRGWTIGREVDIVGKEALPFLQVFRSEIIVFSEDIARAGRELVRGLLRSIDHPDLPPLQEIEVPTLDRIGAQSPG